jgi:leader peptidase (prepilin peptidase)/N-methyltransferase
LTDDGGTLLEAALAPPYRWVFVAACGVFGALWGSFLNVCIHRVGLYESVVRPRSRCPRCGRAVRARDNVPIVSYLLLRGRCRDCSLRISVRYPLVEALTALLAVALFWRFVALGEGDGVLRLARFFTYFAWTATLLVLIGIDLDHMLIPDRITYPAIPLFFVAGVLLGDVPPRELLIGAAAGYGTVALVAEAAYLLLGREGMGYGDAKLLMLVGALTGWKGVLFTFFVAPFPALVVALPILYLKHGRATRIEFPFGPFLAAAGVLYLFVGARLLAWFGL